MYLSQNLFISDGFPYSVFRYLIDIKKYSVFYILYVEFPFVVGENGLCIVHILRFCSSKTLSFSKYSYARKKGFTIMTMNVLRQEGIGIHNKNGYIIQFSY